MMEASQVQLMFPGQQWSRNVLIPALCIKRLTNPARPQPSSCQNEILSLFFGIHALHHHLVGPMSPQDGAEPLAEKGL